MNNCENYKETYNWPFPNLQTAFLVGRNDRVCHEVNTSYPILRDLFAH